MTQVFIEGVGLCGPGLDGWVRSAPILAGLEAYIPAPENLPPCLLLPANERRRAPKMVKLALGVGAEAFAVAGRAPAATPAIFTSSGGDGETIHDILNTLALPPPELSPTKFHNSVHNAAAGYWSIATGAKVGSTSLCCHDDSFAAGLLEAMAQMANTGEAVVLIAYDVPYPATLGTVRSIGAVFGVAILLSPTATASSFARLGVKLLPGVFAPSAADSGLEALRQSTPAARCLPLLAGLAGRAPAFVNLDYLGDMTLALEITPCAAASVEAA